jgi:hypothetical protein
VGDDGRDIRDGGAAQFGLPRRLGALLPAAGARLEGPTFEEWLTSDDAATLAL